MIAVRFLSKSGNTEKLARAIAEAAGVQAVSIGAAESALSGETDLLFLGSAVYAFGLDETVKAFIQGLDPAKVKRVAVFSTTAVVKSVYPHIKKLLDARGIPLLEKEFHCRGEFKILHQGRPNAADLERAGAFARELTGELA
ncbi:MAG: flavodoxin [Treponema sp.]|jgi:flavodoxin|nr:flavodoxin [Treponema sp.]